MVSAEIDEAGMITRTLFEALHKGFSGLVGSWKMQFPHAGCQLYRPGSLPGAWQLMLYLFHVVF
jgi:hypothetical protein